MQAPQLQPSPPTNRILYMRNAGLAQPHIQIINTLTSAPLYTVFAPKRARFSSDPHLAVTSSITNSTIATIYFHHVTDDIDLVIYGQDVALNRGPFSSSHEYQSRMPGGGKLKRENHDVLKGGDVRCTNGVGSLWVGRRRLRCKKVQKLNDLAP